MSEPTLDVVVVAFRAQRLLRACLASLHEHPTSAPMRVWVVDNASGDRTAELVRHEFPSVELIASAENLGFGAANNLVLRRTRSPYALVLNPDTRVTAGALDRLVALMEEHDDVGMCGPRLVRDDGSFDHAARRSFPTPLSALGHFTGVGRRAGASGQLAAYRAPDVERGPVDAINGAFMLLRRKALDEVGLFDEGYWMYMEDLDLCYRFAQRRWTVWYEPSVTVVHTKAGTTGARRSLRLNYAFHYGMHRFYRKFYAPGRSAPVNAAVLAGIWTKFALSAARSAVSRRRVR
jgi:hypothetical protein